MKTKEFTLTQTQSKVVASKSNYIEWSGNDRAIGKTFAAFVKMLVVAQENTYSVCCYLTNHRQVTRHTLDANLHLFEGLGKMSYHDMCFKFANGSKIFFDTVDGFLDGSYRCMRPSVVIDNARVEDEEKIWGVKSLVIPRLPKYAFMLVNRYSKENTITETTYVGETINPYIK